MRCKARKGGLNEVKGKDSKELKSEDFSLLVAFLLVTFSWLFRGPHLL